MGISKVSSKLFAGVLFAALMVLLFVAQPAWAADEGLVAGDASSLQTQAAKDYYFEYESYDAESNYYSNPQIVVRGVKSGKVSYSKKTKTLTLKNVKMKKIELEGCKKLTIKLVGKNAASERFIEASAEWRNGKKIESNATIAGTGSMKGCVTGVNNLRMRSGFVLAKATSGDSSDRYAVSCGNMTMSGGKLTATATGGYYTYAVSSSGNFSMRGGELTATAKGDECARAVSCSGDMAVSGGKLVATATGEDNCYAVSCSGNFSMRGGELVSTAKTTGKESWPWATAVSCSGDMAVSGGSLVAKTTGSAVEYDEYLYGINCSGKLTISGGRISLKECDGTCIYCKGMTIEKGSVLIDDQYSNRDSASIHVYGANLVMTGGTLKITRSYQEAIYVQSYTTGGEKYRGRTTPTVVHGGKIQLKGGTFVAKVRKPRTTCSIQADSIASKVPLKNVNGWIDADGARFKYDGSTYSTMKGLHKYYSGTRYRYEGKAELVKYGGKSASVSLDKVKYNGHSCEVNGVAPGAFGTAFGAKVKSVTFEHQLETLGANVFDGAKFLKAVTFKGGVSEVAPKAFNGASRLKKIQFDGSVDKLHSNAFAGAKSLTVIHLGYQYRIEIAANAFANTPALRRLEFDRSSNSPFSAIYTKKGTFKSVKWSDGVKISKNAFTKCGKNGKGVKVTFSDSSWVRRGDRHVEVHGIPKNQAGAYRKLFISKGMPASFKLQTRPVE